MEISKALLIAQPSRLDEILKEAKAIINLGDGIKRVNRLLKYNEWSKFGNDIYQWANPVDLPFVNLMASLSRHGYDYNCISMHKWWRRLKAVNQHHLITYFSYVGFQPPGDKLIWWSDVYTQCLRMNDMLEEFLKQYRDDKSVEMNLRSLLGISQQADIHAAWREFAKANHPDKGGSVERFVLVKSAYEEYSNV